MACATVCLTVVPSFSDITAVSTIGHSFKTDRSRTPLFHVAQYEDDIIGRELNLRKLLGRQWESNPQPSEQLPPITIKTSASTETATAAYNLLQLITTTTNNTTPRHSLRVLIMLTLQTTFTTLPDYLTNGLLLRKAKYINMFNLFPINGRCSTGAASPKCTPKCLTQQN